ncbi:MAG: imidazole glycerol phosphate synthase subunit HisH [Lachnospiraceae bacterium]|nr:imidazole glycerol phosphate synthase subunit HisH [Lachnospiraceae bacterium]
MLAIIDYDAGNIKSVEKAVQYLGKDCIVTRDRATIESADQVILPGVGAFGDAMKRLDEYELVPVIRSVCEKGVPFLGICLGLQLLFDSSEESPGAEGLGILKGTIKKLPDNKGLKVPNIGWNSLELTSNGKSDNKGGRLFRNVGDGSFVYFVHSYYLDAKDKGIVTSNIDYGVKVDASIESGNIFATQFHPEKSSETGLTILENFINVQ